MEKFTYLGAQNVGYIEELFQTFLQNPQSVDPDWRMFFEGIEFAKKVGGPSGGVSQKELRVYDLIRAYRQFGHRRAKLDPLGLQQGNFPELELSVFGLEEKDLGTNFTLASSLLGLKASTLAEIKAFLEKTYCGTFTAEFSDCYPDIQRWMLKEMEKSEFRLEPQDKKETLEALTKAESLERFIHTRFVGAKRFSVEGGDALLPMMEHLLRIGVNDGIQEVVLGMAHRGRVNMLATYCRKPVDLIFAEFEGAFNTNQGYTADGDVKYHMGYSSDREIRGQKVHLSMAFNPSHLEAVDPVVCGMARAKQRLRKDNKERRRVIPVLVHGDAAFIGQGVVSETLQMSQLEGYTVGGTVHIVVNNQVGFTTSPEYSRSSTYCTDVIKALRVPVLHVNGDDVEACLRAMDIAYRFRQTFHQDVVVDVVCYRRYGHNEGDEPSYTQPVMYQKIKDHPTLREIYSKQMAAEGVVSEAESQGLLEKEMNTLQAMLDKSRSEQVTPRFFTLEGVWKGLRRAVPHDFWVKADTKAEEAILQLVGKTLTTWPQNFTPHPKLQKLLESRRKMLETRMLDWGMAELLAYGALVAEGIPVRVSGQDAGRGTFTHRHAIFHDVNDNTRYSPLNTIQPDVADFAVHDSLLSEMGVLGFEYGNSTTDPRALTIWEAQFGDFCNGAQIIIDQFIASAESKWQRMNGLVLLLPHGYEGQGPEHSSARLERFLQLCAQENMQVAYPTTPAQIFHVLRRQVKRDFRKPLIIMSPKSLLRHPRVVSPMEDLVNGYFKEVIVDPASLANASNIKRLVLCTGKIYYEILDEKEKNQTEGSVTAIARLEQIYPFAAEQISQIAKGFPNLKQIIWAQEEPKNMGAYTFVAPRLQEAFAEMAGKGVSFRYVGRTERASPAIGSPKVHSQEQMEIIKGCFK